MKKIITWQNGSGNITLTYEGLGDGPILIESDPNDLSVPRSKVLHVQAGRLAVDFTVNQAANIIDYVDLGLPSGRLWAKGNIVKDEQGNYSIGEPSDNGCYFSWGNTEGHAEGSGYNFSQAVYDTTPGAAITDNLSLSQDAARANLDAPWRMPTAAEMQELYDNCTSVWTTLNGVNGRLFTSNVNGITLFFPAAGYYIGSSLSESGSRGSYWLSTYDSATNARSLFFNSSGVNPQRNSSRRNGLSVRAVR